MAHAVRAARTRHALRLGLSARRCAMAAAAAAALALLGWSAAELRHHHSPPACGNPAAAAAAPPYLHPALRAPPAREAPGTHLVTPRDANVAEARARLQEYLSSPAFAAERAAVGDARGLLVVAGGRRRLTQLVVLLRVLRRTLRSALPVEVAWQGASEMDAATLAELAARFGPLTGFDVDSRPLPPQHRRVPLRGWVGKVAALLQCSFGEVLLLDADALPLLRPEALFDDALYTRDGNLWWPDFWGSWVQPGAWAWAGLAPDVVQPLLAAGAGWSGRDAETGVLLLDRRRWLAPLHLAFMVNAFSDRVYHTLLHGAKRRDKDTFKLGFALAGNASSYRQVAVPPGGVFRWGRGQLELRCREGSPRCATLDGWQLLGALQHDNSGRPVVFHRTMNKLTLDEPPWPAQLVTGPLPRSWLAYYLAHDALGPTKGVWWEHAAPPQALEPRELPARRRGRGGCPGPAAAAAHAAALEAGLPVEPQPWPCRCDAARGSVARGSAGSLSRAALSRSHLAGAVLQQGARRRELPDATPVPALVLDSGGGTDLCPTAALIRAAQEALTWLRAGGDDGRSFAMLRNGSALAP